MSIELLIGAFFTLILSGFVLLMNGEALVLPTLERQGA